MKRFKYKILTGRKLGSGPEKVYDSIKTNINKLGAKGWELIGIWGGEPPNGFYECWWIFKRELKALND